jgi:hypothetical protein
MWKLRGLRRGLEEGKPPHKIDENHRERKWDTYSVEM